MRGSFDGAAGAGLRFAADSSLVQRALERIDRGPRRATDLAREVLALRSAPDELARDLMRELLGADPRVAATEGEVWRRAGRDRALPDAPLPELDYTVVDVETTGTSPARGARVMEIAAVQVGGGEIVGEFHTLVDPGGPIPPWISRLTGITEAMVSDAPPFGEVADLVRQRLEGRVFVAHNVPFDWRFLTAEMRRARAVLPTGPRLCTLRLARRLLPELPRKGLDAVTGHYGIEIDGRHRAAGDALATAELLVRLLEEAARAGIRSWGELGSGAPRVRP